MIYPHTIIMYSIYMKKNSKAYLQSSIKHHNKYTYVIINQFKRNIDSTHSPSYTLFPPSEQMWL